MVMECAATPAVNAAATLMLFATTTVIILGFFAYRYFTRGQRSGMHDFAAQI